MTLEQKAPSLKTRVFFVAQKSHLRQSEATIPSIHQKAHHYCSPQSNMVRLMRAFNYRALSSGVSSKIESLKQDWKLTLGKTDDDKAYTIKLNNISLKTPLKNLLRIHDETLALAIANEWKSKVGLKKIDLKTMHLTTMAYEALDNPFNESKDEVVKSILEYLKFDTIRFRDVENEELLAKQSRHWDPLVGWFEHNCHCHLPIEYGSIVCTGSLPNLTQETVQRNLGSLGRWPLIGIRQMTTNLKSYVLARCLTERFLKVEQAVDLARLETRHQTEKWSKVEWEHDIDEQCTRARVAAGTLFYHLSL